LDDYCGSYLYDNGTSASVHPLTKILTPEGYVDRKNNTNEHGDAEEDRVMSGSERKTAICNGEIKKKSEKS
jgi:hypothetical protein